LNLEPNLKMHGSKSSKIIGELYFQRWNIGLT